MSSIHKVRWQSGGKEKTAWAVDYFDQDRKKRRRTFRTRREAVDWNVSTQGQIRAGVHTPDSKSITVIEAARLWLDRCRLRVGLAGDEKIEWSTVRAYDSHVAHIAKSSIATVKLSRLAMPMVEAFKDKLLETRSRTTARSTRTYRRRNSPRASSASARVPTTSRAPIAASMRCTRTRRQVAWLIVVPCGSPRPCT